MKTSTFSAMKKTEQSSLDVDTTKEMLKCLTKLTTSGSPTLDEVELKKFKKFCRKSDDYVRYAFILIMEQMEKKHSEVRLSAFQVAAEIFSRSHAFREILVTHLQEFFTFTTGLETNQPLPPPKAAANRLKEESLRTLQQWHDNYGKCYRKLDVGYNYLKNCKHVNFQDIQAQNEAERMRQEQMEEKNRKQMADRLAKVLQDISENKLEIEDCIQKAENCLKLLLPTPDNFLLFTQEDAQSSTLKSEQKKNLAEKSHLFISSSRSDADNTFSDKNEFDNVNWVNSQEKHLLSAEIYETKKSNDGKILNKIHTSHQICNEKQLQTTEEKCDNISVKSISSTNVCGQEKDEEDSTKNKVDGDSEIYSDEEEFESESDSEFDNSDRAHGFSKPGFSIDIEMPVDKISVKETEDNTDVLQSLKDAAKLVAISFLPRVTKWLEVLGKNGANQTDIKAMIDIKLKLETIKSKCAELKLISMKKMVNEDSDDDEDLEDVPEKEGYEATVCPQHEMKTSFQTNKEARNSSPTLKRCSTENIFTVKEDGNINSLKKIKSSGNSWNIKERETAESLADPTSRAAALARIQSASADGHSGEHSCLPSTSTSDNATAVPFVEFGKDLAHWDNPSQIEAPDIVKLDSLHRFWVLGEKETEKASQHDVAMMLNRTFHFTGKFEPVKWSCRAPLPSGKLCPRMDRVKCPFHGPIIPRDEDGSPSVKTELDPSSSTHSQTLENTESELPPWKDPELQKEIEAATGHDLGSARSQKLLDKAKNKGKGKSRKKPKSGLTNLKTISSTSRNRLEKKVFNRGSMKRVCANLDSADYKRVRDKFGSQFNYSM